MLEILSIPFKIVFGVMKLVWDVVFSLFHGMFGLVAGIFGLIAGVFGLAFGLFKGVIGLVVIGAVIAFVAAMFRRGYESSAKKQTSEPVNSYYTPNRHAD